MENSNYASLPPVGTANSQSQTYLTEFKKLNKKIIFSVALTIFTLSTAYALLAYVPKYKSDASVMIKNSAITAKYVTEDDISTSSSSASNPVLNTMALLKSDLIADSLWNRMLATNPDERKRLEVNSLEEWKDYFESGKGFIAYKNAPGTDVISLSFTWTDPKLAKQGMGIVLDAFKEASQEMNKSEHHERYTYLSSQIMDVKSKLEAVRKALTDYRQKYHVSSIDKDIENYSKNRIQLEFEAANASAESSDYNDRRAHYQQVLGMTADKAVKAVSLGGNQSLAKLYDNYYTLSESYASLKTRYTDEHHQVKEVKNKLTQTEEDIRKEMSRMGVKADPELANRTISDETRGRAIQDMLDVESKYKGARGRAAKMKQYLGSVERKMAQLPAVEEGIANLTDQEISLSDSLKTLEQKALDAKIRETQTLSNLFVIDAPHLPKYPDFPGKSHIILLGALIGLAAGFGVALAKQRFLDTPTAPLNLPANGSFVPVSKETYLAGTVNGSH